MASQGYWDWVAAGKPYALIRPAKMVQANIRRHGLTVYDYPDDSHLLASRPEDHTPFSVTGWPSANKRWKARALDIMPRNDTEAAREENAAIAIQIITDKDAGVPGTEWIKYLNYTDDNGHCWHVSWEPSKVVTTSTDAGHVHISGRSDVDDDARADNYDPVARLNGVDMEQSEQVTGAYSRGNRVGDVFADTTNERDWWYSTPDKVGSKNPPPAGSRADIVFRAAQAIISGQVGGLTDAQVETIGDKVAAAVVASSTNSLTQGDLDSVKSTVKAALREGTGA